jgi:hypothetical protein
MVCVFLEDANLIPIRFILKMISSVTSIKYQQDFDLNNNVLYDTFKIVSLMKWHIIVLKAIW